jgi:hypothetical protein
MGVPQQNQHDDVRTATAPVKHSMEFLRGYESALTDVLQIALRMDRTCASHRNLARGLRDDRETIRMEILQAEAESENALHDLRRRFATEDETDRIAMISGRAA